MSERAKHALLGTGFFAAWCALAPLAALLAHRSKTEWKLAQSGMPSWGGALAATLRWRREPRGHVIVPPAPRRTPDAGG